MPQDLPAEFLEFVGSITQKRAKAVIQHILKHGHVTTEELASLYGYNHPPRGARDVRELGIPLETFRVASSHGRKIAAYRFPDAAQLRQRVLAGRKVISKEFKQTLVTLHGSRCAVCLLKVEPRYLQVDHRVPYEVAGEGEGERDLNDFMLICGSCNRARSWSCEHCLNRIEKREPRICKMCYWADPETYSHIAMQELRRLDVTWEHGEVGSYDKLAKLAKKADKRVGEFVKSLVQATLKRERK